MVALIFGKRDRDVRKYLLVLFLIAWFAPVSAADGVLEINQACAAGAGCFPGDDPGFPVRITSSGSYILTSNLAVPAETDGITNRLDKVPFPPPLEISLDLNGFTISSTTTCDIGPAPAFECTPSNVKDGYGIYFTSFEPSAFSIRNGVVKGMAATGVSCESVCRIENVHATQNAGGGITVFGQVRNSIANVNAAHGITSTGNFGVVQGCTTAVNKVFGLGGTGSFLNNATFGNYETQAIFNTATAIGNVITGILSITDTGVICSNCVLRDNTISGSDTGINFNDTASIYGGNIIEGTLDNAGSAVQDGTNLCNGSACP